MNHFAWESKLFTFGGRWLLLEYETVECAIEVDFV